jgi:hypothetical protein
MEIYDTNVLIRVVPALMTPPTWFLNRFFPSQVEEDSEEISIDVIKGVRRVAPFVSPLMPGKMVEEQGFLTNSFKPAYVKDLRPLDGKRALKRSVGERIGGNLSPQQRIEANLNLQLTDQLDMLHRRLELMAVDALLDGKTTVTGEGFDTQIVDFLRDAALTVTLSGATRWGETGVSPAADIKSWAKTMIQKSGAHPVDLVFSDDAFEYFIKDPDVLDSIETRRGGESKIELGAEIRTGAVHKGTWGQFNLWTYNDWYIDDAGVEQPILPASTVIMGSGAIEGVRAFGSIQDEHFLYGAMAFAPRVFIENNPGVRYLLMQSAPLPIPSRVDASFCATVR